MRISNRLLSNAAANYIRLGCTFALGIFFTWYTIGTIGVAGLGMIAFAAGAFGVSGAVQTTLQRGLVREMAAAIASGRTERVRESLASAMVVCAPAAGLLLLLSGGVAGLAWLGVFKTPAGVAGLPTALAVLLAAEGLHQSVRVVCAPYTQALFAAQRIGLDNVLLGLTRVTNPLSAVLVFGILMPQAPMAEQLYGFAASRAVIQLVVILFGVGLAKRFVAGLELDRRAFSRAEFRSIVGTVWHTGQVSFLMDLNVQFTAILINLFFGMTFNGVWHVVVQLGGYGRLFAQALLRGVDPLSVHMLEQGRRVAAVNLMLRTIRYQLGALLPVVTGLVIFMHPILDLWVGGRMAGDPHLAEAGITVAWAIDVIAVMAYVHLAAQVVRTSVFGVERILYGMGEIRSYSWFAKYAAALNVGLAALLMWRFKTPVVAPVGLLLTYIIYYPGVILGAARRRVGLSLGWSAWRSMARPVGATAVLAAPMLLVRSQVASLSLLWLAVLVAASAALYGVLFYAIVVEPDERSRIRELVAARAGRGRGRGRRDDDATAE